MRLLYFFGKIHKLDGELTDYVSVNFSREYEFDHNGKDFFTCKDKELCVTVSCPEVFLPNNFWSENGKVYNCTVFVGNNGSGKTSLIHNIICEFLYIDKNKHIGKTLMVFCQGKRIHAIARANDELFYTSYWIKCRNKRQRLTLNLVPHGVDELASLTKALNTTRIAYFSNTFSENDLLNHIMQTTNDTKENYEQNQLRLNNYSLTERVTNIYKSRDASLYQGEQIGQYWNNKYKEEARFVLSEKAQSISKRLKEGCGFEIPIPNRINIKRIDSVVELLNNKIKKITDNSVNKLLDYVYQSKTYSENETKQLNLEDGPTFYISIHALLRFVAYMEEDSIDKLNEFIRITISNHQNYSHKRVSADTQRRLLESIKKQMVEIFDHERRKGKERLYDFKDRDEYISTIEEEYEKKKTAILKTYEFVVFLYNSEVITKFRSVEFNYKSADRSKILKLGEDTEHLKNYTDIFTEFIDKYSSTLLYSSRPYLSFSWGLSSGQDNVLDMLASLYNLKCSNNSIQTLQVYLDEADIGYHPEWQRAWFYIFPQIVEEMFNDTKVKDIQFLLGSHSPLLLGDIPSRCAKYVENSEHEKIRIEECWSQKEGEYETFGQNLYTILRNGFFLKKGAIGEIAVKKSEEITRAFNLLRELCELEMVPETNNKRELIVAEIKANNEKAKAILKRDAISYNNKDRMFYRCSIEGNIETVTVEYDAYLYYIKLLIMQYSSFIRNTLMKEYLEIVASLNRDKKSSTIKMIDEEIKRLNEMKKRLVQNND